ncbi:MAG: GyrI-like domain-containing protein [Candidatus Krumholzibacteria bacterium]|nr:GyrI-like domain-containing protein [Candidatus Krumholzibacteria bacterium]
MRKSFSVLILFALAVSLAAVVCARSVATNPGASADTSAAQAELPLVVQLKVDTAFAYCALEMTGSYDQHGAAFQQLYGEAAKQGIIGAMPFGIYWNSPSDTPAENLKWEIGFAVPAGKTPQAPLVLKKWEYTTMASLRYTGELGGEGMGKAMGAMYKWIGENGYRPAGPMMETYLSMPSPNEKGVFVGSMEIIVPVQKAPAPKETKNQ